MRALETGIVDAAVMTTRAYALALKQKGFNVLAEVFPAMSSSGIVTRRSFIERNQATVENVIKALIEAEYFILSPRGRTQTVKTIINRLKLSDPNLAEEGYADIVKEFDAKPYPSLEGLKNMQRLIAMQNPKLADINTASLIANEQIDEAMALLNAGSKLSDAYSCQSTTLSARCDETTTGAAPVTGSPPFVSLHPRRLVADETTNITFGIP